MIHWQRFCDKSCCVGSYSCCPTIFGNAGPRICIPILKNHVDGLTQILCPQCPVVYTRFNTSSSPSTLVIRIKVSRNHALLGIGFLLLNHSDSTVPRSIYTVFRSTRIAKQHQVSQIQSIPSYYFLTKYNRISTKEHLTDKPILVDRLGLCPFSSFRCFSPHLPKHKNHQFKALNHPHISTHFFDIFQNHIAMTIKGFDPSQEFVVIAAADQHLIVVLDGLLQHWQRTSVEFQLFLLAHFVFGHFRSCFWLDRTL